MADSIIKFPPDSTDPLAKQVVFNKNSIPGVIGDVYYQYIRLAQPPTYIAVANNSVATLNKNHIALFNNLGVRLRIEHICAHPHTGAAGGGMVGLQVLVITTNPSATGTEIPVRNLSSDFISNPAAPNNVVVRNASTVTPIADYILGGGIIDTSNTTVVKQTATLFKKDIDYSSIQLLTNEGIVVRQISGPNAGTMSVYVVFTLDTA